MGSLTLWENTATATLLVWMIKADGLITTNEKKILTSFVSDNFRSEENYHDTKTALTVKKLLGEPISTEEALNIARTIRDERHIESILSFIQLLANNENDDKTNTTKNKEALRKIEAIFRDNLDSQNLNSHEAHPLKRIIRGEKLSPLPSISNYLKSHNDIELVYPTNFNPVTSTWNIRGKNVATWATELGLAGKRYTNSFYAYQPKSKKCKMGILILPGGFVDFRAYAKVAASFAQRGILCVVQNVPLGFALFDNDNSLSQNSLIRKMFPGIEHWCLAGHSLGGVAAAKYISKSPNHVDSLMLWGSFPSPIHCLKSLKIPTLSISGTHDGLVPPDKVMKEKHLLPSHPLIHSIEGANHTQFGDYWDGKTSNFLQYGDHPAGISRENQLNEIVRIGSDFLNDCTF